MSIFRVGMRVRVTGSLNSLLLPLVGCEGVITKESPCANEWHVDLDGHGTRSSIGTLCSWNEMHLEPLTNPGVDSIITSILKEPGADFNIPGFMPEEWRRAWGNA